MSCLLFYSLMILLSLLLIASTIGYFLRIYVRQNVVELLAVVTGVSLIPLLFMTHGPVFEVLLITNSPVLFTVSMILGGRSRSWAQSAPDRLKRAQRTGTIAVLLSIATLFAFGLAILFCNLKQEYFQPFLAICFAVAELICFRTVLTVASKEYCYPWAGFFLKSVRAKHNPPQILPTGEICHRERACQV